MLVTECWRNVNWDDERMLNNSKSSNANYSKETIKNRGTLPVCVQGINKINKRPQGLQISRDKITICANTIFLLHTLSVNKAEGPRIGNHSQKECITGSVTCRVGRVAYRVNLFCR